MGKKTKNPTNSKTEEYQEALEKLEVLADAGEALAEADTEQAAAMVALASRLLKVSETIAEAAAAVGNTDTDHDSGDGEAPDGNLDSGNDDDGDNNAASVDDSDTATFMASMKTTLERINATLDNIQSGGDTQPPPSPPQPPEQSDDSQALNKDLKQVLDAVKKQQRRLSHLEKQYGLPNSMPSGEAQGGFHDDDESWPRDMNAPVDRDSVDKSVSFHDAPGRRNR